jgi:hypothetical protein
MILTVNDTDVEVRAGTPADIPLLLTFIRAMAAFEKLEASATEESVRSALFGDPPAARTLLAFVGGKPIGYGALMAYLAGIALQNRCARFEWIVLDWNTSAIEFYKRLGAECLPDWRICRVDEAHLAGLASALPSG